MISDATTIEIPLTGGRTTPGVVRVGDTVRRPKSKNTLVIPLLTHLTAQGFDAVPRYLGTDERGRDSFTFIPGEVQTELGFHNDVVLRRAANLIRDFHDQTLALATDADGEVICHNDLSPCNFVFRDGVPVAIIDFDAVSHGTRASDLGYAAWLWLDLGNPEIAATEQRRRLALFVISYGNTDLQTILTAILQRQELLANRGLALGDAAMADWAKSCLEWTQLHAATMI